MKTFEEMENEIFENKEKDTYRLAKAATLWRLKNNDDAPTTIEEVANWFNECGYNVEIGFGGLCWMITK